MEKKETYLNNLFVSLFFSILFYMLVGEYLSIEYLVNISLVVIGATWSYLAVEINEVKQLRDEYIEILSETERYGWRLVKESLNVFHDVVLFKKCDNGKDVILSGKAAMMKRKELRCTYNSFVYNSIKLEEGCAEKEDLVKLNDAANMLFFCIDGKINVAFSDGRDLCERDESEVDEKIINLMTIMGCFFNRGSFSFEEFSESYKSKKNACTIVVSVCFFSILIKSFSMTL